MKILCLQKDSILHMVVYTMYTPPYVVFNECVLDLIGIKRRVHWPNWSSIVGLRIHEQLGEDSFLHWILYWDLSAFSGGQLLCIMRIFEVNLTIIEGSGDTKVVVCETMTSMREKSKFLKAKGKNGAPLGVQEEMEAILLVSL